MQLSLLRDVETRQKKAVNPVAQEIDRLSAAAARVLEFLRMRGARGATNVELSTPEVGGLAGVRRVWDLTQQDWLIEKEHVSRGVWRYRLVGRK